MNRQEQQERYHRTVAQRLQLMSESRHLLDPATFAMRLRLMNRIIDGSFSCGCDDCMSDPYLA